MDWSWIDTCAPCLDPDSVLPWHRGAYSIPTFQTHSRYFYAPLGEDCCGLRFVQIFYQQFHPFPHCQECAQFVLYTVSFLCWHCRTYFRRYGTGTMQQIVGISPQRHDYMNVRIPDRGRDQRRLPDEDRAQQWRNDTLGIWAQPIVHMLLPRVPTCTFLLNMNEFINQANNQRMLVNLPTIQMPFFSMEATLPLPPSPEDGYRSGLSLYLEEIEDAATEGEDTGPPPIED